MCFTFNSCTLLFPPYNIPFRHTLHILYPPTTPSRTFLVCWAQEYIWLEPCFSMHVLSSAYTATMLTCRIHIIMIFCVWKLDNCHVHREVRRLCQCSQFIVNYPSYHNRLLIKSSIMAAWEGVAKGKLTPKYKLCKDVKEEQLRIIVCYLLASQT